MSRILKVSSGDYRLKVQSGGKIYIDTGTQTGETIITGNLTVLGTTTTIESTNASIKDNVIVLNDGQTGDSGISLITSGLRIDRGQRYLEQLHGVGSPQVDFYDAELLFDETVSHYDPQLDAQVNGTFVFKTDDEIYSGIKIASIAGPDGYDFSFDLQNSSNLLRVINQDTYADDTGYVAGSNPGVLTTKAWVEGYITSGVEIPGIADVELIYKKVSGTYKSYVRANSDSTITFAINGTTGGYVRAIISVDGLDVDNVNILSNTVSNTSLSNNLIFTASNNHIEVNGLFQLDDTGLSPSAISGATKIYTVDSDTTPAPGKTGIYFTNLGNSDELVAKNRALLFSILF